MSRIAILANFFIALAVSGLTQSLGQAGTLVSPSEYENTAGPDNNAIPLRWHRQRYQQIYGASDLSAMVGQRIVGIAFRADERSGFDGDYAGGFTFPSLEVLASVTSVAVNGLTADLDGNHGANLSTVKSGSYTIPPLEGDLSVNPFDYAITFDTPFLYQGGNLLLEFRIPQDAQTGLPYVDAVNAVDAVNRAYTDRFGGIRAGGDTLGLITQFSFVPEPSAAVVLATLLTSLAVRTVRMDRPETT